MALSDPLDILLAHDRWATRQVLDACRPLTHSQFHHRFEMGVGSLHDTLAHMNGAMQGWTDRMIGREFRRLAFPPFEEKNVDQLLTTHAQAADEFVSEARRLPLDQTVERARDGKVYRFTRGAVLMQVLTHGVHHRAQCLNMLRQLGIEKLPPVSVIEWVWHLDPP
ncbi:MAG: DUF664 domain-containing protein [Phycisphaera sp.]|nr:DUF664 domain-containing protein [Phycisphaera sp.]